MPGPEFLTGERVSLYPIEESDLSFVAALRNDPEVRRTTYEHTPRNRQQVRQEWEETNDGEDVHLVVVPTDEDEPVGLCSLTGFNYKSGSAEIGYAIAPEAWENGYATAAAELLCGYAFEERRLVKVTASVYETNPASARVLEKAGFTREARLRKDAFVEGEHVAVLLYGHLREEWTGGERPETTDHDTADDGSKRA
jgi:RimJ/RimL family protein N-acetyltransferase